MKEKKNKIEKEIGELKLEADDYKNQAKNTKDSKLKNTYLSEAKERDSIITLRQKQADELTIKHDMLSTKADSINTLQEMQNEVLAQINNISENNTEDIAENKGANTENKEIPKETVKNEELIAKAMMWKRKSNKL